MVCFLAVYFNHGTNFVKNISTDPDNQKLGELIGLTPDVLRGPRGPCRG